ncbi:MAG: hypothetical protein JST05_02080 [Acidobacteria bacterium]|nr:hypothetical protein [Acidobacteriota bacterium]
MLSLDRARMVADYLRARAEVHRASLATIVSLTALSIFAARMGAEAPWTRHGALLSGLIILPFLLRAVPIKGTFAIYRLELVAFPLNILLLGLIGFLEANRLPRLEIPGYPAMRWFFPALSLLLPLGYLVMGFSDWMRRAKQLGWIRDTLAIPPVEAYLEEPEGLVAQALSRAPGRGDAWAQFRTVPASARNLKLFLRLDTARHGWMRTAFSDEYALVFFHDGSGCEAVAPGGVQLAVDDAARPGERERMILVRWNAHFHEGRILSDDLLKIQAWNSRSAGFEPKSIVPPPF